MGVWGLKSHPFLEHGSITASAYAGWAVTAGIPVKFCTTHGALRPEVGSTKRIGASGQKGGSPGPPNFQYF